MRGLVSPTDRHGAALLPCWNTEGGKCPILSSVTVSGAVTVCGQVSGSHWGSVSPSPNRKFASCQWDGVSKSQWSAGIYLSWDQFVVTSLPTLAIGIIRNLFATIRGKKRSAACQAPLSSSVLFKWVVRRMKRTNEWENISRRSDPWQRVSSLQTRASTSFKFFDQ